MIDYVFIGIPGLAGEKGEKGCKGGAVKRISNIDDDYNDDFDVDFER